MMVIAHYLLNKIRIYEFLLREINSTLKLWERRAHLYNKQQLIRVEGMMESENHYLANILPRIGLDKNHQQMLKLRDECLIKNRMFLSSRIISLHNNLH